MAKYDLTAEELFVIDLLFLASAEERHPEFLYEYVSNSKIHLREVLFSLQEKGIILKSWKLPNSGERFDPETVVFNKNLNQVLFCIRAKEPYKGLYNFVGGKVEE